MIKQVLLCATFLALGLGGITAADQPTQPPALAETPVLDFKQVLPAAAPADDGRSAVALLSGISAWLSSTFGLPTVADVPRIEFVAPARLTALRYRLAPMLSGPPPGQPAPAENHTIVAVYDDHSQTIFLADDWRGASPADQSVLVHEVVHHLQNRARMKFDCPQQREKLAYQAQERWLAQFGKSLESEFQIDPMTLLIHVNCM